MRNEIQELFDKGVAQSNGLKHRVYYFTDEGVCFIGAIAAGAGMEINRGAAGAYEALSEKLDIPFGEIMHFHTDRDLVFEVAFDTGDDPVELIRQFQARVDAYREEHPE